MLYFFIALAIAIAFGLYVSVGPKLKNMNEGMWTITVEMKMPGMETSIPAVHSQFLTKANPVPEITIPGYECHLRELNPVQIVGNHMWWKVYCEGPGPNINGNAHARYVGDTLKGRIDMCIMEEDQKNFDIYIAGSRTGDRR